MCLTEKSALAQFCVDLTARASEGLIDPVVGRHSEIERIVQILCRRTKNNPILLGESGVGKTAIAEGLAISISQADAPVFLLVCFFTNIVVPMVLLVMYYHPHISACSHLKKFCFTNLITLLLYSTGKTSNVLGCRTINCWCKGKRRIRGTCYYINKRDTERRWCHLELHLERICFHCF